MFVRKSVRILRKLWKKLGISTGAPTTFLVLPELCFYSSFGNKANILRSLSTEQLLITGYVAANDLEKKAFKNFIREIMAGITFKLVMNFPFMETLLCD